MSLLLRQQALATLGPGAFLATVVSIQDPENQNRVQLRVYDVDGVTDQDATVWARVAVPFAGGQRGSFFIPDVGDEVVVVYLSGDPRFPIVIGGLWNGADSAPETIPGDRVDRWTITGTQGTKIAIVEDSSGPTISFTTPGGLSGTMTDSTGSIEFTNSEQTSITIDMSGVTINAPTTQVQITAADLVSVTAPQLSVDAAMATFSGVVQCQVMQATTVIATTYTPGAGNVW
ncbi:MAG: phage baseplate assembly protein V [Candidatus Cybelea sp.]